MERHDMIIEPLAAYITTFIPVPENEKPLLTRFFKRATFRKNTVLEQTGAIARNLYFIEDGFIRTFYFEDGEEITTHLASKDQFTTAFNSFISTAPSTENIKCITDCTVHYVTKTDYERLGTESTFWSSFCKQVYERMITHAEQRTNDLLALTAEKRYLKFLSKQPELGQYVPVQYIASYLGIKPESLSRIRRKINS